MVKVATQTPIISLFLLILSLETSFIPSIALNLLVVAFCILFMLYYRRFKMLAWMIILAILPSFANYWAVQLHGDASQAVMLGTRAFVTVCIGLVFVSSISLKELLLYLGSKGAITLLVLCLDCGIQFFSSHSARNQVPQRSLPITWSRTTFLVALDLQ
ncbi:cobalt ABC transporter domain-containing protein [Streptococcus pneumoniae]|nr:cobalt ABC transporter domain-containing protein [Streptococcus pneumoniae]